MCGRYYRTADKQKLAEALRAQATGDSLLYAPGYNIAPTTTQPVLRQERDTFSRELVPMRWGLVGFGSKGINQKRTTFNARAEGLEQSSLWSRPLHRHRCIIPMDGDYEWLNREEVERPPLHLLKPFPPMKCRFLSTSKGGKRSQPKSRNVE